MFNYQNLESEQFEELCHDIMQTITGRKLHRFSPGKDGGVDLTDDSNTHSIVVQVKHYEKSDFSTLKRSLEKEIEKVNRLNPQQYYVCVSQKLTDANINTIYQMFSKYMVSTSNILTLNDIDDFLHQPENIKITKKHTKLWLESGMTLQLLVDCLIAFYKYFLVVTLVPFVFLTLGFLIFYIGKKDTVPEVYRSMLAPYSMISKYKTISDIPTVGFSSESLQEFKYAFSIVSHLRNQSEGAVKVDRIMTTISDLRLDETVEIEANAVIKENLLKVFLINNSWGTSGNINVDYYYGSIDRRQQLYDFATLQYENENIKLAPGDIIKGAVLSFDLDKYLTIRKEYLKSYNMSSIPIGCQIDDGLTKHYVGLGILCYTEDRGFYLTSGDRDDVDDGYCLIFLKLDVDEASAMLMDSGICNIIYNGSDSYPIVDNLLTIETAIAPTKSCYLKCYNTFEIQGQPSKTEEFWTHVTVPFYCNEAIGVSSSLTPILEESDEKGEIDLKRVATSYVYDANSIMPHSETFSTISS